MGVIHGNDNEETVVLSDVERTHRTSQSVMLWRRDSHDWFRSTKSQVNLEAYMSTLSSFIEAFQIHKYTGNCAPNIDNTLTSPKTLCHNSLRTLLEMQQLCRQQYLISPEASIATLSC
ncbi:hypothetical protein J6590_037724 [Homalodisca vitripennis]|nr:hypothetical protein J6590_037724 [Homalodisca vitripennis]